MKDLAFDRRALDRRAFVGLEPVEARRQQRLDRRWHLELTGRAVVLLRKREHLLDEEWVALGRRDDASPRRWIESPAGEVIDQIRALFVREWLE